MRNKIELINPITINGKKRKEFEYDFNAITCDQFCLASSYASAKATELNQKGILNAAVMEQDSNLHMYLGMMAIIAADLSVDITDLERITGYDLVKLAQLGRNFIAGRSEETSSPSSSDEQSEATPESTIPESKKSSEEA